MTTLTKKLITAAVAAVALTTASVAISTGWNTFSLVGPTLTAGTYYLAVLGSAQTRLSARAIGTNAAAPASRMRIACATIVWTVGKKPIIGSVGR